MILKQDASDNGWGRVMLWPDYHGGPNQKWKLEENQIVSHYEDLCLDLKRSRYLPSFISIIYWVGLHFTQLFVYFLIGMKMVLPLDVILPPEDWTNNGVWSSWKKKMMTMMMVIHSGQENLKKSRPKNSWNQINQFHDFFLIFFRDN